MLKIKIEQNYYGDETNLYPYKNLNLNSGITVLVGCNGSGKTTLLHQIKDYCRANDIEHLCYDNLHDGGSNARESMLFHDNLAALALDVTSSEGERIYYNISRFAPKIRKVVHETEAGKPFVLLIDAIDSGLDAVTIEEVKRVLLDLVVKDCESIGVVPYIILTSNSYETARGEQCISVANGKYISIKSYEKYRSIVQKTHDEKIKRYEL